MTADDHADQYNDNLINHAMLIVGAVHGDGPDVTKAAISRALAVPAPVGVDPVEALVVTLAAMVDADRQASDLLAWTQPIAEYRRLRQAGVSEEMAALLADHLREAAA